MRKSREIMTTVVTLLVGGTLGLHISEQAMGQQPGDIVKPEYRPIAPSPGTYPPGISPALPGNGGESRVPNAGDAVGQSVVYLPRVVKRPITTHDHRLADTLGFVWPTPAVFPECTGLSPMAQTPQVQAILDRLLLPELSGQDEARDPRRPRYRYLKWTCKTLAHRSIRLVWPQGPAVSPETLQCVEDHPTSAESLNAIARRLAEPTIGESCKLADVDWAREVLDRSPLAASVREAQWQLACYSVDKRWNYMHTQWETTLYGVAVRLEISIGEQGSLLAISAEPSLLSLIDADARRHPISDTASPPPFAPQKSK